MCELFSHLKLAITVDKTKSVLFKTPQSNINLADGCIQIRGLPIHFSRDAECLGVTLSSDTKWNEHFRVASRKCYAVIASLARLKQLGYDRNFLLWLYDALLVPVLSYGISVRGSTYRNVVNRFQVIQNDAIRTIMNYPRKKSVRAIHKQKSILDVKGLADFRVAVLMYKHYTGRFRLDFINAEPLLDSGYNLRSNRIGLLHGPAVGTALRGQSPSVHFVRIWNALPSELKTVPTTALFKKGVKEYLVSTIS